MNSYPVALVTMVMFAIANFFISLNAVWYTVQVPQLSAVGWPTAIITLFFTYRAVRWVMLTHELDPVENDVVD